MSEHDNCIPGSAQHCAKVRGWKIDGASCGCTCHRPHPPDGSHLCVHKVYRDLCPECSSLR